MSFRTLQDDLERAARARFDLDVLQRLVDRIFREIDADVRRDQRQRLIAPAG